MADTRRDPLIITGSHNQQYVCLVKLWPSRRERFQHICDICFNICGCHSSVLSFCLVWCRCCYSISYRIVSYRVVSCRVVSSCRIMSCHVMYHIISCHIMSCHIISYHIISYIIYHISYRISYIISYHISYHVISYHIISYHIISYYDIDQYHLIRCDEYVRIIYDGDSEPYIDSLTYIININEWEL